MQVAGKQCKKANLFEAVHFSREYDHGQTNRQRCASQTVYRFFSDNVQGAICTNILVWPEGERILYPNYLPVGDCDFCVFSIAI